MRSEELRNEPWTCERGHHQASGREYACVIYIVLCYTQYIVATCCSVSYEVTSFSHDVRSFFFFLSSLVSVCVRMVHLCVRVCVVRVCGVCMCLCPCVQTRLVFSVFITAMLVSRGVHSTDCLTFYSSYPIPIITMT